MNSGLTTSLTTLLVLLAAVTRADEPNLVALANPLQGTDSNPAFSHGNTYPEIALPFPMNTWSPYTEPQDNSFFYQYRHHRILGFRQSHEPSVWIREHAAFSLMPVSGKLAVNENDRASTFRHETEVAFPSYYKVHLDAWNVDAELTPTARAARLRFTFGQPRSAYVVLDVFKSEEPGSVQIIPGENKIIGITRDNSGAVPSHYGNYFVIVFDRPFSAFGVWSDTGVQDQTNALQGRHVGAYVKFDSETNGVVECKVASSFISPEQAERNLDQEIGNAGFDAIRRQADAAWNEALGVVQLEGGSTEERSAFYSALYRSILFPHCLTEFGQDRQPIYRSPYDGDVHAGVMYTDSGYWDTFRAAHPLYNLLYPGVSAGILQAVIASYHESGWLPSWSSPGNRQAMIGNHAFSLLADGWCKGIRSFDAPTAVQAMVHDAHAAGPFGAGREGAPLYDSLGYLPYPGITAATSKTLEFAYDDYCAAVVATASGQTTAAQAFRQSAMNYTNVYDAATGFMRGRQRDGSWTEPFTPVEWGGPYVEGNAWQWTWSVMQDVPGLIQLMGGDQRFCDKLDALFSAGSEVKVGTYHTLIHEMNEMVAQNLGQYAHGNEPVHHVVYLYDYAGQPWKTQVRVRQLMRLLYQPTPDGLCGDEDTGQMSAWYVLSALGIYPVCPGNPNYAIGSPLFTKATLKLANGKTFTIVADHNGPQEYYIDSAVLNGQPFGKSYLSHAQILAGGELRFQMTSMANQHWASGSDDRPPSALAEIK